MTGPGGTISAVSVTPVSGSNDHEFTISFPTQTAAGTYTLKVAPTVQDWYGNDMNQNRNGVNGEPSDAFVETIRQTAPGSTDLLSITGIPTTVTAGTSETFTVTALSPNGGTDTGYLGTIEFSSTDPQADLPAIYPFTAADAGTFTFTVTFKTAGSQAITATDTANGAIIGTEDNIIVQAACRQLAGYHRLRRPLRSPARRRRSPSPPTTPTVTWPPAIPARWISPAATARRVSLPIKS